MSCILRDRNTGLFYVTIILVLNSVFGRKIEYSASLNIECDKVNLCADGQKCMIGECRKLVAEIDSSCDFNCTNSDPVCASNGENFASHCEMERENCLHGLELYAVCHNDCPCSFEQSETTARHCDAEETKEKVAAYFHERSSDDFSELLASSKDSPKLLLSYAHQQCPYATLWGYSVMDLNQSGFLEEAELIDLYLTFNDPCVVGLVTRCDRNGNGMLSVNEWCYCMQDNRPPCFKALNAVPVTLEKTDDNKNSDQSIISLPSSEGKTTTSKPSVGQFYPGSYIPMCDKEGYFLPTQTWADKVWCVDEIGHEIVPDDRYGSGTECSMELQALRDREQKGDENQWDDV